MQQCTAERLDERVCWVRQRGDVDKRGRERILLVGEEDGRDMGPGGVGQLSL